MTKRLFALLALLALTACSTNPFEPHGTVSVTFMPADAGASSNTILYEGLFKFHSRHEGDFTARVPAGRVTVSASSPGYDSIYETVDVPAGQTTHLTLEFLPRLTGTASSFTVTRYETARLTLYGLRAHNYTGPLTVIASWQRLPAGYSRIPDRSGKHMGLQGKTRWTAAVMTGGVGG